MALSSNTDNTSSSSNNNNNQIIMPDQESSPSEHEHQHHHRQSHLYHRQQHRHSTHTRAHYVTRLMDKFQTALEALGALAPRTTTRQEEEERTERMQAMSNFIFESMSNTARNYHYVQHVFDVIEGNVCRTTSPTDADDDEEPVLDAVAVLAALFHDCVYSPVDGGLSTLQRQKLRGAIVEEEAVPPTAGESSTATATVILRTPPQAAATDDDDLLLRLVLGIFGFEPGQILSPIQGQNEFLSAVIAVRELEPLLPKEILVQIAACIEATIPFRAPDASGAKPMDRLYARLCQTVRDGALDLSEEECVRAVQRAALVGNEDVGNFGSTDHAWFLDNTWSLLPESNEALREEELYTVEQFLFAVYKLRGFFGFMRPELVFQTFRGVPDPATTERLTRNAARNLHLGGKYVSAKLLMISVIAAFAELTGGDSPISLFMGDMTSRKRRAETMRLECPASQFSSDPEFCNACDGCCCSHGSRCCKDVYELLVKGRTRETFFDARQSPFSAYLYCSIGDDGLKRVMGNYHFYPMTPAAATELLAALPRANIVHIGEVLAEMAVSRKEEILNVLRTLPSAEPEK